MKVKLKYLYYILTVVTENAHKTKIFHCKMFYYLLMRNNI